MAATGEVDKSEAGDTAAVLPRPFCGSTCPLLIIGAWQLSAGHSTHADQQAKAHSADALLAYAKAGLSCFDCADIYTGVEELLGMAQVADQKLRIHTKCVPDLDVMMSGNVTCQYLEAGIMRSLNRLQMDALDLVQLHWWEYEVPGFEQACRHLGELMTHGLIRTLGLTNTDLKHLRGLVEAGCQVASNQVQLSLLDRRPLESGMAAFCECHGIELLCYGVLAGGFLTDRWLGQEDPGFEGLENRSLTKYRLIIDEYGSWEDFQRLLRCMDAIARRRGTNVAGVAVGWVLRRQCRTRAILGARKAQHAAGMAASLHLALGDRDMAELNAQVAGRGIKGEVFEAERAGGRHTGIMRRNLNGVGGPAHLAECLERTKTALARNPVIRPHLHREIELLRALGNDVSSIEEALQAQPAAKCARREADEAATRP
mmetsp:Transcript_24550/g.70568  ORF Transcript_24550/g.70568 Transcript_24550/m.70568 type:complete len:429 (-) Transcript_24550:63-1349(-)